MADMNMVETLDKGRPDAKRISQLEIPAEGLVLTVHGKPLFLLELEEGENSTLVNIFCHPQSIWHNMQTHRIMAIELYEDQK